MTREISYDGYFVKLKDNVEDVDEIVTKICKKNSIESKKTTKHSIKGFSIKGRKPQHVIDKLLDDENVVSVEPDIKVKASAQTIPWPAKRVGCERIGSGLSINAHIFILDTGVQKDHPDINLVESLSFIEEEPDTDDLNGHGTMSAGCAAAKDNDSHVVGIAPGAAIHSYKVLGKDGSGYLSDIIAGIDEAIWFQKQNPNIRVIMNMSLGGYAGSTSYNSMDWAIYTAVVDYNIPVVVAAGNEYINVDMCTPSHTKEAITVGAYNNYNVFASFSNFGSGVDILAPGESILTTSVNSGTATASGTSFAAPYVAGAVALYISKNPAATPLDIVNKLKQFAIMNYGGSNPRITRAPTGTTQYKLVRARFSIIMLACILYYIYFDIRNITVYLVLSYRKQLTRKKNI